MGKTKTRIMLNEWLQTLHAEKIVFIGSRSNFLYIGKQRDSFLAMRNLDDVYREKLEKRLAVARQQYEYSVMLDRKREMITHEEEIQKAKKRIADYVPFGERYVKEVYKRFSDEGTVIIIEGREQGKYWDIGKELSRPKKGET